MCILWEFSAVIFSNQVKLLCSILLGISLLTRKKKTMTENPKPTGWNQSGITIFLIMQWQRRGGAVLYRHILPYFVCQESIQTIWFTFCYLYELTKILKNKPKHEMINSYIKKNFQEKQKIKILTFLSS